MLDLAALKTAARAAIVMPAVFAFADKVIGQPQTSIFTAFGSFAVLVLVEFGGPVRARFLAYVALACAGAAFITLGTLCSRDAWLGAATMALLGFATLFSGVFGGYFAAAATGALVTFVLPVTLPAPNSAILDRLEGWGLATGVGICAVTLLWPPRRTADLQREAAAALRTVADFVDAGPEESSDRARQARDAVAALGRRFLSTQHRPTGPTGPTAALASLPDELDWFLSFLAPSAELQTLELVHAEDVEAIAATAALLRAAAETLDGNDGRPDFARLDRARNDVARGLMRRLPELPTDTPVGAVPQALEPPFRIRAATYSPARSPATHCLQAGSTHPSSIASIWRSHHRRTRHSKRQSSSRSSTQACARCGSRTASAAPPGSRSPSSSLSALASNTDSGSSSEPSPCCGLMRSAPAGRFSAHSSGPPPES